MRRLLAEVFLEQFAVLIDQERHDAGLSVFSRVGEEGEAPNHVTVDDVVSSATFGVWALLGQNPEQVAVKRRRCTWWDPFFELSPQWTDEFFAFGASIYKGSVFTPKFVELLSIAFDASVTHMCAPGTRRHIKSALKLGATPEEFMTTLQICVSMGIESCAMGVPILAEELERFASCKPGGTR